MIFLRRDQSWQIFGRLSVRRVLLWQTVPGEIPMYFTKLALRILLESRWCCLLKTRMISLSILDISGILTMNSLHEVWRYLRSDYLKHSLMSLELIRRSRAVNVE